MMIKRRTESVLLFMYKRTTSQQKRTFLLKKRTKEHTINLEVQMNVRNDSRKKQKHKDLFNYR